MTFNLPDKLYKLIVFFGVVGAVYYYFECEKLEQLNNEQSQKNERRLNQLEIEAYKVDRIRENLILETEILASINRTDSPIKKTEEGGIRYIFAGSDPENPMLKLSYNEFLKYNKENLRLISEMKSAEKEIKLYDKVINEREEKIDRFKLYILGFLLLTGCGVIYWKYDEATGGGKNVRQDERIYKHCQSCGDYFDSIITYGYNSDGSKNLAFCKNCFSNDSFIYPDLTKEEFLSSILQEINLQSKRTRKPLTFYASLERWKNIPRTQRGL